MSDDSTPVETVDVSEQSLAEFKAEFFGKATPKEEPKEEDETPDVENADAEVEEVVEGEEPEAEVEDDGDEPEVEDKPHRNRKTAKERISETIAQRNEERAARLRAESALQALEARLAKLEKTETPSTPEVKEVKLPDYFPDEDAVDKDGQLVYPLGKFDPQFNADLVKATMRHERDVAAQESEQRSALAEAEAAQAALISEWNGKLEETEETLPDLREKIAGLEAAFVGLDAERGIFLAEQIMQLDRGPEVLYYLANHISEAEAIVAASPGAALIKLGHIEGRLPSKADEGNSQRVSKAPAPAKVTRGTGASRRVTADTDDLRAFKNEFFNKK